MSENPVPKTHSFKKKKRHLILEMVAIVVTDDQLISRNF